MTDRVDLALLSQPAMTYAEDDEVIVAGVLGLLTLLRDSMPDPDPELPPAELFCPEYDRLCGAFDRRRRRRVTTNAGASE